MCRRNFALAGAWLLRTRLQQPENICATNLLGRDTAVDAATASWHH
jgi:hypothetical protein